MIVHQTSHARNEITASTKTAIPDIFVAFIFASLIYSVRLEIKPNAMTIAAKIIVTSLIAEKDRAIFAVAGSSVKNVNITQEISQPSKATTAKITAPIPPVLVTFIISPLFSVLNKLLSI